MNHWIRSKVVKIGNSRGIRIPRALLEQVGLTDEVEMSIEGDRLIIHPVHGPRQDWEGMFAKMANYGDDRLLDEDITSKWDEDDWEW